MKVIFAGTPEFAAVALAHLHEAGFEIPLVLTQPDRPAGRGMQLHPSPVKQYALKHGMPVAQPVSLRLDGKYPDEAANAHALLKTTEHQVMVVAAYGLILPASILAIPPMGCLNIHASLLPRWRGAAPIHRAIEAGDRESGITIMQMDAGLDTGPIIEAVPVPLERDDDAGSLLMKMAQASGPALVRALDAKKIAGCALDTTDPEPLPNPHPLRDRDNVIINPHAAWYSEQAMVGLQEGAPNEVRRVLTGTWPVNVVNPAVKGRSRAGL